MSEAPARAEGPAHAPKRVSPAWPWVVLTALFVLSRVAFRAAGLHFNFSTDWMFLADPVDLRDDFWRTVWVFQVFPPGMNVLTGLLLWLSPEHHATLAHLLFALGGLVLTLSLFALGRWLALSVWAAGALALAFACLPQSIYLENLYLYDAPAAALATLTVALFAWATVRQSWAAWGATFAVASALVWWRSVFHLAWFAALVAFALWVAGGARRATVASAMVGPALVALALFAKNLVLFGAFSSSSWGGANLMASTVDRLPPETRTAWLNEGRLSAASRQSIFAPLDAYGGELPPGAADAPPALTRVTRPTSGSPNYNHPLLIELNRARARDALEYLRSRPGDYAGDLVRWSLPTFFSPTTHWHPRDDSPSGPHASHRAALGAYEATVNALFHTAPAAPWGVYAFLPLVLWFAIRAVWKQRAAGWTPRRVALTLLCFQLLYVTALSAVFGSSENARYRYLVEPCIWLLCAAAVQALWQRARQYARVRAP